MKTERNRWHTSWWYTDIIWYTSSYYSSHIMPLWQHPSKKKLVPGCRSRKETTSWVASWDSMVIPNMMNLQPFSPNQEWLKQFWSFPSFCKQTTNLWPCFWSLTCFSSSGRFVNEAQNFQKYRRRSMWHQVADWLTGPAEDYGTWKYISYIV